MSMQSAEPAMAAQDAATRQPSRRHALVAMLAMLATIVAVDVLVRLILDGIVRQNSGDWPYNPAVTRIAGSAVTR